jgi:hypothetical protein
VIGESGTNFLGAPVLPDDHVRQWGPGFGVPRQDRFALVGQGDDLYINFGAVHGVAAGLYDGVQQGLGVLLDSAAWQVGGTDGDLAEGKDLAVFVDDDCFGSGGSLVNGQHGGHGYLVSIIGAELLWAEERPANQVQADALGINVGSPVYALQRLRRSDNEPLALETTFYPAKRVPGFLTDDLTGSLWDVLRNNYAIEPARTVANLEVVVLDQDEGRLLETRQAAAGLRLIRRTYAKDGSCFEYAEDMYRADRVSLVIDRTITE